MDRCERTAVNVRASWLASSLVDAKGPKRLLPCGVDAKTNHCLSERNDD